MKIIVTARHGEVPDGLRIRAEQVVARLARLSHRPTTGHVTFDVDHQRATAELRLTAAQGAVHIASAEARDHRTALDRVASKLRRQLDKRAPKRGVRRGAGGARR
jgi:ribosomal subunit interface protein